MATGVVKCYNSAEGFGVIAPDDPGADDPGKDVFVLISAVEKVGASSLISGQKVAYDVEQDRKSGGIFALNLHIQQFFDPDY